MKFGKNVAIGLALALGLYGASAAQQAPSEILNVSYDVSRELFAQLNPVFAAQWKTKTGKPLKINQSHAGSSAQARAVTEGLEADVVTFNQITDVQTLVQRGFISADWQKDYGYKASPFYSLPAFVVRGNNPKNIRNWPDLVKPGVKIVIPNPKTSGNGRYSYLAAYAFELDRTKDAAKAEAFAKAFLGNVVVFDTGGRAATTTFVERGIGDVLITFEAEALGTVKEVGENRLRVVTPPVSLLAEFPVAVVDKVADKRGSRAVSNAYLQFLYSPAAQDIIGRNFYRTRTGAVNQKYARQFPQVRLLTAEGTLGGWDKVSQQHLAARGILDRVFVNR